MKILNLFKFYTTLNIILVFITFIIPFPDVFTYAIYCNVLVNSILGAYICSKPFKFKSKKTKQLIRIADYCFHYLFLLLFLIKFKNVNKFQSMIISLSIGLIYLITYDPIKIYKIKWSKAKFVNLWLFIYMLILIIY